MRVLESLLDHAEAVNKPARARLRDESDRAASPATKRRALAEKNR
jgi:hypothetical protein